MDGHDGLASTSTRSVKDVLSALWAVARRHRRRTLLAVALLVLGKLASVWVPLVLKRVYAEVVPLSPRADVEPPAAPAPAPRARTAAEQTAAAVHAVADRVLGELGARLRG